MAKRVMALLLALLIALVAGISVFGDSGFTATQLRVANALNHLGLFLGTDIGYELERELNRLEGVVLTIRMFGNEKDALSKAYSHPYTDVAGWANKYVGYARKTGITYGISDTKFGSTYTMTDYMFITFTLRALGYKDVGDDAQFVWNNPYELAKSIGLIDSKTPDIYFSRGDAVVIFWNALTLDNYALAHKLAKLGVFSEKALEESIEIYKYGEIASDTAGTTTDSTYVPPSGTDTTAPKDTTTSADTESDPSGDSPAAMKYEDYIAMSAAEQQAYYLSYSDPMDFFAWLNEAKAQYEAEHPGIDIGPGGSIDLEDILG